MADDIDEAASRIDAILVPALSARIAEMGEDDSGAFDYYGTRVRAGHLIADYDRAIARRMREVGLPRIVHEVGGGLGSLTWLLAAIGVDATCIEHNRRRHLGAVALAETLAVAEPETGRRLHVLKASFPHESIDPAGATVIATNLVFTTTAEKRAAMIEAFGRYDEAIIDIDRFCTHTPVSARPALLAEFAAAGLEGDLWLEVPRRACLWRFRRAG